MFLLEIKVDEEPPTIDLCNTVEECADLAIQQIDDVSRSDLAKIRNALIKRRSWRGEEIVITINRR